MKNVSVYQWVNARILEDVGFLSDTNILNHLHLDIDDRVRAISEDNHVGGVVIVFVDGSPYDCWMVFIAGRASFTSS